MIEFDLDKTKLEDPYVDVYYPDGKIVARTNNEKLFMSILLQIKENKAEGFYIAMTDEVKKAQENGEEYKTYPIEKTGRIKNTPNNLFRTYTRLLNMLVP